MKVKLTLEYDGSYFCGWQRQDGQKTVQEVLEDSLSTFLSSQAKKLGVPEPMPVVVSASGRTDSGVHARGQVASFSWPSQIPFDSFRLLAAINGITDQGISALQAVPESSSFDARHSPHTKQYSYHFLCRAQGDSLYHGRAWKVGNGLDIAEMIRAAGHFVGDHDFSSFRVQDCQAKSTLRTIFSSQVTRVDTELVIFSIHGKGFLKQMVRIMAGTLFRVGRGQMSAAEIPALIKAKDRSQAGETAPAHGLYLDWVRYDAAELKNTAHLKKQKAVNLSSVAANLEDDSQ